MVEYPARATRIINRDVGSHMRNNFDLREDSHPIHASVRISLDNHRMFAKLKMFKGFDKAMRWTN